MMSNKDTANYIMPLVCKKWLNVYIQQHAQICSTLGIEHCVFKGYDNAVLYIHSNMPPNVKWSPSLYLLNVNMIPLLYDLNTPTNDIVNRKVLSMCITQKSDSIHTVMQMIGTKSIMAGITLFQLVNGKDFDVLKILASRDPSLLTALVFIATVLNKREDILN
jgi:hypothetical protein